MSIRRNPPQRLTNSISTSLSLFFVVTMIAAALTVGLAARGQLPHPYVWGLVLSLMAIGLYGFTSHLKRDRLQRRTEQKDSARKSRIINLLLRDKEEGQRAWLWESDALGRLTHVSAHLAKLAGVEAASLIGRPLAEAFKADANEPGWQAFEAALKAEAPQLNCDVRITRAGFLAMTCHIEAEAVHSDVGRVTGYLGVGYDESSLRDSDATLKRDKLKAETDSGSRARFLTLMSHELRNPLNSIVGFSEILTNRGEELIQDRQVQNYAATILESSRHLQSLINDLFDATRIDNGTLTLSEDDIDAAEMIELALRQCRDKAERNDVTLVAKLVDGVEIRGDLVRLQQLAVNIIANAITCSPTGAVVDVSVNQTVGGGFAMLVRDGGIGVRQEDAERIFDPFMQSGGDDPNGFTSIGLGLSIARKIARLHEGDISLDSQFGTGTTVRFTLPPQRVRWAPVADRAQAHVA